MSLITGPTLFFDIISTASSVEVSVQYF